MKIAIDISPIATASASAHKVRGVGSYINFLIENLPKLDKSNEYLFVEDNKFPENVDLIHYPYFDPFFISLPFHSGKKLAVTVHDLTPLVFPNHFSAGVRGKAKWLIQKQLLKQANVVIADSHSSKKDIEKIVGIDPSKVKTVYLAAGGKFKKVTVGQSLSVTRQKFSLPENFLLYVGDATWNKNLPRIIDAVKKTKYTLVMVGKVWSGSPEEISDNSWNRDLVDVRKIIEEDPRFIRLGYVSTEELVALYNLADVLVMPSIYEGFGLPIIEAMSSGCPVITGRGGSLPEVAGDAALCIDAESADDILGAIEKVMNDRDFCANLSEKGFRQAAKFTTESSISELVKAYGKK